MATEQVREHAGAVYPQKNCCHLLTFLGSHFKYEVMNVHLGLRVVVYFLQGGDFPSHGGELQISALVLLVQHLLHLPQL